MCLILGNCVSCRKKIIIQGICNISLVTRFPFAIQYLIIPIRNNVCQSPILVYPMWFYYYCLTLIFCCCNLFFLASLIMLDRILLYNLQYFLPAKCNSLLCWHEVLIPKVIQSLLLFVFFTYLKGN
jgi:hypothetical protein